MRYPPRQKTSPWGCAFSGAWVVRNAGAEWEDSEVVVDGNLVSSRKPDDLPAFMRATIELAAHAGAPA
jgi:putative intracellular protease/amidase